MKRAQGLLETIIAIGVMMTGLISVMALVISNLNTQREAATRYQAVNLAREGIELVRNRRDSNWLQGNAAWEDITLALSVINGQTLLTPFENFTRGISIRSLSCSATFPRPDRSCDRIEQVDPIAQEITATVRWNVAGRPKEITLMETLYDWR